MKTIAVVLSSVLFSSCMHFGMMGHGEDHQSAPEKVVEKEVSSGNIKVKAVFPPFEVGKEVLFTVRLSDAKTGQVVTGAKVYFHVRYPHFENDGNMNREKMEHSHSDSISNKVQHDIDINWEVSESSEAGLYSISFTPSREGVHQFAFHVAAVNDQLVEHDLIVEATIPVSSRHDSDGNSMHGSSSVSGYALITLAAMGAMMLVIWVTGGRML